VTSSRVVPVLEQKQRRSAVRLHLAEAAPRLADRAISSELTIEADLAFVKPHRVDGCAYFRVESRELRQQRPSRAPRLRFVMADPQSTKLLLGVAVTKTPARHAVDMTCTSL
jgi:hypothetical protein